MELFKIYHISTDYKDRSGPPNWELWQRAEIVFVDKSNADNLNFIYQIKDSYLPIENALNICKMNPSLFSKEGFILLGQVKSTDRKKKQILLENGNTVSYNHLVIVSGKKPFASFENEELVSALQALYDALKVKPKIPSSFATTIKNQKKQTKRSSHFPEIIDRASDPSEDTTLDKVIQPNFFSSIPQAIPVDLSSINNRLYEVQI